MMKTAFTKMQGLGNDFVVFEAGDEIADSMRKWGHTRLFSPWKHLVDPASRRLLEPTGWELPAPQGLPTGSELVEQYLQPLAAVEPIASRIRTGVTVEAITRRGMDRTRTARRSSTPFLLFMIGELMSVFFMCALISVLFFGGWLSPIPGLPDGALWMFGKMVFFFFIFAMVKAIVPRYRYDQLMRIGWKVFLPLSLGWVALVGLFAQYGWFWGAYQRWTMGG